MAGEDKRRWNPSGTTTYGSVTDAAEQVAPVVAKAVRRLDEAKANADRQPAAYATEVLTILADLREATDKATFDLAEWAHEAYGTGTATLARAARLAPSTMYRWATPKRTDDTTTAE